MLGKFSVKKPYTVLVAVVLVIVLGVVSMMKMSTDLLPNISLPYVIVMTTYPGASPETVEMTVTQPVEGSMATVSNIESISSVSSENYSMVILEFAQSADMNAVSLEIRENLDQIKSYWSDDIGNPIIMKLNPDMLPVMIAAVGGEGMTNAEVTDITQNTVIPDLESIEGVASASATGLIEESVNVIIRQDKIDAINEQVFGSIDEELKDAEQQLAEGRQEIYDGQEKLNDSRADLDESRQQLNDSQEELDKNKKELEDSRQKLADGKAELAENKTKLEEGKNELSSKKSESTEKLAQAEKELLTAKADLEASKVHITSQITTVKSLEDGIKKAKDGVSQLDKAIYAAYGLKAVLQAAGSNVIGADTAEQINQLAAAMGIDCNLTENSSATEAINVLDQIETAATQQKTATETTITNMEASLNANTGGLGADAYIASMQSVLSEIEGNIAKLDSGLTELYKGNLTAAIEFANAQTTISLGEMQITTAEAQIEASEKQLESGQEQIESGQEQIDSGWEQLKEGEEQLNESAKKLQDSLKQLAESEEDLEENRQNAYDQADMNGILTVSTVKSLLAAQNFSMPAGYVTEDGIDYLVRVGDKPEDVEALKKMPIMNTEMDGVDIIYLEDVADVFMTDNSADIYTNVNGNPGVMLTIQKQTGYSTGDVSDRIKEKFKDL